MHNALSNAIMRKLKLFCLFFFTTENTFQKNYGNSKSVIHNLLSMLLSVPMMPQSSSSKQQGAVKLSAAVSSASLLLWKKKIERTPSFTLTHSIFSPVPNLTKASHVHSRCCWGYVLPASG